MPAGAGALVEQVGDGRGTHRPAGEGFLERPIEGGGAVEIEQPEEGRRVVAQGLPAPGEGIEEGLGIGRGGPEPIPAAQLVGVAFLTGEGREVGGLLDPQAPRSGAASRGSSPRSGSDGSGS